MKRTEEISKTAFPQILIQTLKKVKLKITVTALRVYFY
jgi:hypothetical protein